MTNRGSRFCAKLATVRENLCSVVYRHRLTVTCSHLFG